MSAFKLALPGSIEFGAGKVALVPKLLRSFVAPVAPVALVVKDGRAGGADALLKVLDAAGIGYSVFEQAKEPTTKSAEDAVAALRRGRCNCVVGIGGGSVIDTGKAVASVAANGGVPLDYMEVIGAGKPITKPSLPYIAIPTTSGTGAEASANAVLASLEHKQKVSLRSPMMLSRVAIVDPTLTVGCPKFVTATCGLDAICHCLESYVTHLSSPATDGFAREGMSRAARSIVRTFTHGSDVAARTDLALTSLFGGISLANAKLGAVHGFAGPLGGMFNGPHGAVVAACLPAAIRVNVRALRARDPSSAALKRYTDVARIFSGDAHAAAEDGAAIFAQFNRTMEVPGLERWGVKSSDCLPSSTLVQKAQGASSMKGNPIKLTDAEAAEIVRDSLRAEARL